MVVWKNLEKDKIKVIKIIHQFSNLFAQTQCEPIHNAIYLLRIAQCRSVWSNYVINLLGIAQCEPIINLIYLLRIAQCEKLKISLIEIKKLWA